MTLSRRDLLKSGGAVALALPFGKSLLAPVNSAILATNTGNPWFGANDLQWNVVNAGLGGHIPAKRQSPSGTDGIPSTWKNPAGVALTVTSFNPDVSKLLSGALDSRMRSFAKTVPAGQVVAVHHEMERANEGYSAKTVRAVMEKAGTLLKGANPGLKYVQIITSYSFHTRGTGLGAYIDPNVEAVYMDGYQTNYNPSLASVFGDCTAYLRKNFSGMPLGIAETNSNTVSKRPAWFQTVWSFAEQEGFEIMFSWWRAGGTLAWHSGDSATISELKKILSESRT